MIKMMKVWVMVTTCKIKRFDDTGTILLIFALEYDWWSSFEMVDFLEYDRYHPLHCYLRPRGYNTKKEKGVTTPSGFEKYKYLSHYIAWDISLFESSIPSINESSVTFIQEIRDENGKRVLNCDILLLTPRFQFFYLKKKSQKKEIVISVTSLQFQCKPSRGTYNFNSNLTHSTEEVYKYVGAIFSGRVGDRRDLLIRVETLRDFLAPYSQPLS